MRVPLVCVLLTVGLVAQSPSASLRVAVRFGASPGVGAHVQRRPLDLPDAELLSRWSVADDDGAVLWKGLQPGRYEVALDRGGSTVVVLAADSETRLTVTAPGKVNLIGFVRRANGSPVPDCAIWLSSERDGDEGEIIAHCDQNGRFELRALPEDRVLVARSPDGTLGTPMFVADAVGEATLVLPTGTTNAEIRGRVVDEVGKALPDAEIQCGPAFCDHMSRAHLLDQNSRTRALVPPPATTRTNEAGEFRLNGQFPTHAPLPIWIGAANHERSYLLLGVPRAGLDLGEIRLDRAAELRGQVVDHAGAPIAGATVTLEQTRVEQARAPRWGQLLATSDTHGRFTLCGVPPGRGLITAAFPGLGGTHERVDVARNATLERRLVLEPALLQSCQFLDEAGTPLPGVTVLLWPVQDERRRTRGQTDPNGRFSFLADASEYEIAFKDPVTGVGHLAIEPIARQHRSVAAWLIKVPKSAFATASIHGSVLDPRGQPISGCQVTISRRDTSYYGNNVVTDAAGKFHFGPVPAGSYDVAAFANGMYWLHAARVELAAGQSAVTSLRYEVCGTVSASLLEVAGSSKVEEVDLYALSLADLRNHPVRLGKSTELPPGEYLLCSQLVGRIGDSVRVARTPFTIRAGATATVDARLTPVAVRKLVISVAQDAPFVDYSVTVRDARGALVYGFREALDRARAREWVATLSLPPGEYSVRVTDEFGHSGQVGLAVTTVDTDWAPSRLVVR